MATSLLAQGVGDFLQNAQSAGLDLVNSPLAVGLGDFLQEAQATGLDLANSPLAVGIGNFLQQASGEIGSLTAAAQTSLGNFLQSASQSGLCSVTRRSAVMSVHSVSKPPRTVLLF